MLTKTDALSDNDLYWRHYWKLLNDGPTNQTLEDYKFDMGLLGDMAASPALKRACAAAMSRYDSWPVGRAANAG